MQVKSGPFRCRQVILVTHSMGGLVGRYCAAMNGMQDKIAGVVHGVMPAVGAAVAYRRCKVGMHDEDMVAGLVIGSNGKEVTAVFANAPGALQLLPSKAYEPQWLRFRTDTGEQAAENLPKADPYAEIYKKQGAWWALIRDEWLRPAGGLDLNWRKYLHNIRSAEVFHDSGNLRRIHPETYVFYGVGEASFRRVRWQITRGIQPAKGTAPALAAVSGLNAPSTEPELWAADSPRPVTVRADGGATYYAGGRTEWIQSPDAPPVSYESSFWEFKCLLHDKDAAMRDTGDGTVPECSGLAPRRLFGGVIRQQFRLSGFSHEPAYKDPLAQWTTMHAISKIAGKAKRP